MKSTPLTTKIDPLILKKLPKYAQTSMNRASIVRLDVSCTEDGNRYHIIYEDGETYDGYGFKDFLYCIKHREQF